MAKLWSDSPRDVAQTLFNFDQADRRFGHGSGRVNALVANIVENWPKAWANEVMACLQALRKQRQS